MPMAGPRGSFAEYFEWVLVKCESPKVTASPTLDPEPSLSSAMPITDEEPEPTEPASKPAAESTRKPNCESDQVRELATTSVTEGILVENDGKE